jgi:acylphosphatase
MPNVMVEAHNIISFKWRTGCILNRNGCKALISNYQNRITIVVIGEHKKKREFMAVIRHILETINQKLSNKPIAFIPLPGINAFAEYETLLARERKGKEYFIFDEDKPTEKQFTISELLEGIPTNGEVSYLNSKFDEVNAKIDGLKGGVDQINRKLDSHYEYLITLPTNSKIKDGIQDAIKELNAQQTVEITGEIINWITTSFEAFDGVMDDKLQEIFNDIQKTDDVQMKLKLAIPLINLVGVNFETEFDVKNWVAKTYNKHELKLFKLMGLL